MSTDNISWLTSDRENVTIAFTIASNICHWLVLLALFDIWLYFELPVNDEVDRSPTSRPRGRQSNETIIFACCVQLLSPRRMSIETSKVQLFLLYLKCKCLHKFIINNVNRLLHDQLSFYDLFSQNGFWYNIFRGRRLTSL